MTLCRALIRECKAIFYDGLPMSPAGGSRGGRMQKRVSCRAARRAARRRLRARAPLHPARRATPAALMPVVCSSPSPFGKSAQRQETTARCPSGALANIGEWPCGASAASAARARAGEHSPNTSRAADREKQTQTIKQSGSSDARRAIYLASSCCAVRACRMHACLPPASSGARRSARGTPAHTCRVYLSPTFPETHREQRSASILFRYIEQAGLFLKHTLFCVHLLLPVFFGARAAYFAAFLAVQPSAHGSNSHPRRRSVIWTHNEKDTRA